MGVRWTPERQNKPSRPRQGRGRSEKAVLGLISDEKYSTAVLYYFTWRNNNPMPCYNFSNEKIIRRGPSRTGAAWELPCFAFSILLIHKLVLGFISNPL